MTERGAKDRRLALDAKETMQVLIALHVRIDLLRKLGETEEADLCQQTKERLAKADTSAILRGGAAL